MNYIKHKVDDGRSPNNGEMRHFHVDVARSLSARIFKLKLHEQGLGER